MLKTTDQTHTHTHTHTHIYIYYLFCLYIYICVHACYIYVVFPIFVGCHNMPLCTASDRATLKLLWLSQASMLPRKHFRYKEDKHIGLSL